MFLREIEITPKSTVKDIVNRDYRTAQVFRKYGIEYCCGGKWPLETVCMMKGIEMPVLKRELETAVFSGQMSGIIPFESWDADFLAEYIIRIHHYYLRKTLPDLAIQLDHFVDEHRDKYSFLEELQSRFRKLDQELGVHLAHEEESIFPYIKRIAHAYNNQESYGGLLVKTLRKPLKDIMDTEHEVVFGALYRFRELTSNYIPPEKACTSHRVLWSRLKELDNDLIHHMHLENDILFPKVLAMEKEILSRPE